MIIANPVVLRTLLKIRATTNLCGYVFFGRARKCDFSVDSKYNIENI